MNTEAIQIENQPIELKIGRKNGLPISEYVRLSVEDYFSQLNGHPVKGVHGMVMREVEKPLIETVLKLTNQNQTRASDALGISRSTLRKKMIQYSIR